MIANVIFDFFKNLGQARVDNVVNAAKAKKAKAAKAPKAEAEAARLLRKKYG